ncbi:hypothetical protein [Streptomyces sp. NPDC051132]
MTRGARTAHRPGGAGDGGYGYGYGYDMRAGHAMTCGHAGR